MTAGLLSEIASCAPMVLAMGAFLLPLPPVIAMTFNTVAKNTNRSAEKLNGIAGHRASLKRLSRFFHCDNKTGSIRLS